MEHAYPHLVSRDVTQFWTSGQWMTERKGGSDVGKSSVTTRKLSPLCCVRKYGTLAIAYMYLCLLLANSTQTLYLCICLLLANGTRHCIYVFVCC